MGVIRRWLMGGLISAAAVYAAICAGMFFGQRSLIYYPQPARQAVPALMLPNEVGQLQVSVREREGAPALIYFGGNAEDVSGDYRQLARLFPGHALYLMHYRGYGRSDGEPTEAALHADARRLYEHVASRHARVQILGRSLGSGVAVRLASEVAVDRLVLVTPYDSLVAVAGDEFPWLPVRWLLRDRFDSVSRAGTIGVATTLIAAERDTLILPERTARLLAHFRPGVARQRIIGGAGHNDISGQAAYEQALVDALE